MFNASLRYFLVATLFALTQFNANAQSFKLSGKVRNDQNEALVGANVLLLPTKKGAVTDTEGDFKINNISSGDYTIKVSYVGYVSEERSITLEADQEINFSLTKDDLLPEEVIVSATRASRKTPTTFTNVKKKEIEKQNLGQDLPILLNYTPSVVTTSDAGAGVGYTGIRIRGSDATRINVTINGVPINDAESHGTFWVNMPDLASSTNNIQIQRGVGTSTNGAAAFGASINMLTGAPSQEAFGEVNNSFGSFNTRRHNVIFNTGKLGTNWSFEGRLSSIHSDGYIDRASSDLQSYFLSGGYYGEKTIIKAIVFGGKEKTYQSWWGTPQARLENDIEGMQEVISFNGYTDEQAENLLNSGRTFNYYLYENETDNYQQDHYQLHFSHEFDSKWLANAALHYTNGRGYYEQYRENDDFADYSLPNLTIGDSIITSTDLVRRRWLDNDFYGFTYSLSYAGNKIDATFGGAYNEYYGGHFGEIIWARFAANTEIRDRYYDNFGNKFDFNTYLKVNAQLTNSLSLYGDLQLRNINYKTKGIDADQQFINTGGKFSFFNPKFGATYQLEDNSLVYFSVARSNREPVRNDFVDAPNGQTPKHEQLTDYELGYRADGRNYNLDFVAYYMDYTDQLVLTGAVNDVGSNIRTNVENSYRTGIELIGNYRPFSFLQLGANLTLSQNKIENFTEVIYDYGTNFDEYNEIRKDFDNTDISFSPNVIGGGQLILTPIKPLQLTLLGKYVGKQYLDNTSNDERAISSYFVSDFVASYSFGFSFIKRAEVKLMVNNIFNKMYTSNGYTFGYNAGATKIRENYYYPQAGTNFLLGLNLRF